VYLCVNVLTFAQSSCKRCYISRAGSQRGVCDGQIGTEINIFPSTFANHSFTKTQESFLDHQTDG
jgi:hypothetical protein